MKKIYITESQLQTLIEKKEEVLFQEFIIGVKSFLKDLLKNPGQAKLSDLFSRNNITKKDLLNKMSDLGLIKKTERIDEVPIEETSKKVAKRFISYKVPKARFQDKMKQLYKELFKENVELDTYKIGTDGYYSHVQETEKPQVFKNSKKIVSDMINMDDAYRTRGGYDESLVNEDGASGAGLGGATSCQGVMQAGGTNPNAGTYDTVFGGVQDRDFWKPAMTRGKNKKNKSMTMNRKK